MNRVQYTAARAQSMSPDPPRFFAAEEYQGRWAQGSSGHGRRGYEHSAHLAARRRDF